MGLPCVINEVTWRPLLMLQYACQAALSLRKFLCFLICLRVHMASSMCVRIRSLKTVFYRHTSILKNRLQFWWSCSFITWLSAYDEMTTWNMASINKNLQLWFPILLLLNYFPNIWEVRATFVFFIQTWWRT